LLDHGRGARPSSDKPPAANAPFALPGIDTKWTGDLDGMIKRRLIRILAPYSKTFYFVDRGVQRSLIYEISEIFERDLNRRLKTGNVKVHVAIIPLARAEFIAALRDGRGDVAMGNLMITPDRAKLVEVALSARVVLTDPRPRAYCPQTMSRRPLAAPRRLA